MSKDYKLVEINEYKDEIQAAIADAVQFVTNGTGDLGMAPEVMVTILHDFLQSAAGYVSMNQASIKEDSYVIRLGDLFYLGIAHNESDEAEKEGNFVPTIGPGPKMFEVLDFWESNMNESGSGKYPQLTKLVDLSEDVKEICDATSRKLKVERNLNIQTESITIFRVVESMMLGLLNQPSKMVGEISKNVNSKVDMMFANLFRIGITNHEHEGLIPYMTPCSALKLEMKNDAITEED